MDITLLESGTKLTVETKNSIYQITVLGGSNIKIMGGMNKDGEIRYPRPTEAVFIASILESESIPNCIIKNMKLQFQIGATQFATSPVFNVEVESPDGNWTYSMGWNSI